MIRFPKAKINVGLRVTGKRPDGYHDIETIFYPIGLSDALEFVISTGQGGNDELVVSGIDIPVRHSENLVMKAVRKLRERCTFPAIKIHLHKSIPAGAGLGGGSSDAASIIVEINRYFNLAIGSCELAEISLEIGSDCPFFISSLPSYATGRGEILKTMGNFLEGYHLIVANPGINISTRDAYLNCIPSGSVTCLDKMIDIDIRKWKKHIRNDFEDYVFRSYPQIGEIKKSLYRAGALFSSMSGSGSSVYGIFEKEAVIPSGLKDYIIYRGIL